MIYIEAAVSEHVKPLHHSSRLPTYFEQLSRFCNDRVQGHYTIELVFLILATSFLFADVSLTYLVSI